MCLQLAIKMHLSRPSQQNFNFYVSKLFFFFFSTWNIGHILVNPSPNPYLHNYLARSCIPFIPITMFRMEGLEGFKDTDQHGNAIKESADARATGTGESRKGHSKSAEGTCSGKMEQKGVFSLTTIIQLLQHTAESFFWFILVSTTLFSPFFLSISEYKICKKKKEKRKDHMPMLYFHVWMKATYCNWNKNSNES